MILFLLLFLAIYSWKAFYTGSTGLSEFPEFVAVNLLNDEVMGYFDSRTNRFESKQSWVEENMGQQYVERQTNILRAHVPSFKANIGIAMERFNQSKGKTYYATYCLTLPPLSLIVVVACDRIPFMVLICLVLL